MAPKTGGDDLDDGLEIDNDLIAQSDNDSAVSIVDNDGDFDGYMTDEEDKGPRVTGQKRKIDQDQDDDDDDDEATSSRGQELDEATRKAEKKRRRKEKEKERKAKRMANNPAQVASNRPATHLAVEELSEMLLASIRDTLPAASVMEIEDLKIPDSHLLSPPDTPIPSFENDPFNPLCERLKALLKSVQSKKPPVSTPRVIILSLSGMRCADVVRVVKPFKGQGEVGKLFAKHFKMEDQIKYLAKTRVSIAVGTPARIAKLLAEGALKINKDTTILLDATYKDNKQRSLLTLPEIRKELWQSIFSGPAREKIMVGGAKIGAF